MYFTVRALVTIEVCITLHVHRFQIYYVLRQMGGMQSFQKSIK